MTLSKTPPPISTENPLTKDVGHEPRGKIQKTLENRILTLPDELARVLEYVDTETEMISVVLNYASQNNLCVHPLADGSIVNRRDYSAYVGLKNPIIWEKKLNIDEELDEGMIYCGIAMGRHENDYFSNVRNQDDLFVFYEDENGYWHPNNKIVKYRYPNSRGLF